MTAGDVDLNLLRVLDALLSEGSVAKAAVRLNLSAPAVSRALGRLRRSLGDPLFVRSGRGLVPTPLALAIQHDVRTALDQATRVLSPTPGTFDPSRLKKVFAISAGDAIVAAIGHRLVDTLQATAPGVQVTFLPDTNEAELLRSGKADLDLGSPHGLGTQIEHDLLFNDHFVVALRQGHPLATAMTAKRFAEAHHVVVSSKGLRVSEIDRQLAAQGLERNLITVVSSFVVAAHIVADSDAVTTLPSATMRGFKFRLPIVEADHPVALPPLPVTQSWHRRNSADPAHQWLRGQVRVVAMDKRASDRS